MTTYQKLYSIALATSGQAGELEEPVSIERFNVQVNTPDGLKPVSHIVRKRAESVKLRFSMCNAVWSGFEIPNPLPIDTEVILICARDHLIGVPGGWVKAGDLKVLDAFKHHFGSGLVLETESIGSIELFDIQVNTPEHWYYDGNGVLHHNTLMVAGMVDVVGHEDLRSITIVPSADLVDQTSNTFKLCGIEHGLYSGAEKNVYAPHVIATWQALQNNPTVMEDFQVAIVDECFAGDAQVMTPSGNIRIDNIKIGDFVLSKQDEFLIFNKVEQVFVNKSSAPMLELTFDNGVIIKVTEDHEFYTDTGKVRAKNLSGKNVIEIGNARDARDARSMAKINSALMLAHQTLRVMHVISTTARGQKIISATLNNGRVLSATDYKRMLARLKLVSLFDGLYSTNSVVATETLQKPRTVNRKSTYCGKGFRSSWEALFWSQNQHLLFESPAHRKVLDDGSVFIPDFIDPELEIVYEVKPRAKFRGSKSERGLLNFSSNGWAAIVISEDILKLMYKTCDRAGFDADTLRRLDNSFKGRRCV